MRTTLNGVLDLDIVQTVTFADCDRAGIQWELCDRCSAENPEAQARRARAGLNKPGQVIVGAHEGTCDCCIEELIRSRRRDRLGQV